MPSKRKKSDKNDLSLNDGPVVLLEKVEKTKNLDGPVVVLGIADKAKQINKAIDVDKTNEIEKDKEIEKDNGVGEDEEVEKDKDNDGDKKDEEAGNDDEVVKDQEVEKVKEVKNDVVENGKRKLEEMTPKERKAKFRKWAFDAANLKCSVELSDVAFDQNEESKLYLEKAIKNLKEKGKVTFGIDKRFRSLFRSQISADPTVEVSAMKLRKLYEELDRCKKNIKLLQKSFASNPNCSGDTDEFASKSTEEKLSILKELPRPSVNRVVDYECSKGFRIVDLQTFRIAFSKAQDCGCGKFGGRLAFLELEPTMFQEDLATFFSLVCSRCQKATIFPNTPFSEGAPSNFSVNKHLLINMGPAAYFKMVDFVQRFESNGRVKRQQNQTAQLILSLDNYDFLNPAANVPAAVDATPKSNGLPPKVNYKPDTHYMAKAGVQGVPIGSFLTTVQAGTRIVGEIFHSQPDLSGLPVGVYKVEGMSAPRYLAVQKVVQQPVKRPSVPQLFPTMNTPFRLPNMSNIRLPLPISLAARPSEPSRTTPPLVNLDDDDQECVEEEEEDDDCPDMSEFLEVNVEDQNDQQMDCNDSNQEEGRISVWPNDEEEEGDGLDSPGFDFVDV